MVRIHTATFDRLVRSLGLFLMLGAGLAAACGDDPVAPMADGPDATTGADACVPTECRSSDCGRRSDGCGGIVDCGPCEAEPPDARVTDSAADDGGVEASREAGTDAADGGIDAATDALGDGAEDAPADAPIDAAMDAPDADAATDGCVPVSCSYFGGALCGPVLAGCGVVITCSCAPGKVCTSSLCCTPKTCNDFDAGSVCITVTDGCGSTLHCGSACAPDSGGD